MDERKEIKKINSKQRQLMYELISGATAAQAATRTGFSESHISIIKASKMFQEEMKKLEGEVRAQFVESEGTKHSRQWFSEQMDEALPDAVDTLRELTTDAENESVRLKGASEIIAMAGMKQPEKVEAKISVIAPEGLAAMLADFKKMKEDKGDGN